MTRPAFDAEDVLSGYAADADALIARFEALSSEEVLAPVLHLLPPSPSRVLDIGAGTGRDAAWLAALGHRVVAVEPVAALREAGRALHDIGIEWLDDRLPDLAALAARSMTYDLILLVGVWQHLPAPLHARAIGALAKLLAPGGRLILSVRHGPGAPARPCYPADPREIIDAAGQAGLRLLLNRSAGSIQQRNRDAGVTWTWLCLEKRTES